MYISLVGHAWDDIYKVEVRQFGAVRHYGEHGGVFEKLAGVRQVTNGDQTCTNTTWLVENIQNTCNTTWLVEQPMKTHVECMENLRIFREAYDARAVWDHEAQASWTKPGASECEESQTTQEQQGEHRALSSRSPTRRLGFCPNRCLRQWTP